MSLDVSLHCPSCGSEVFDGNITHNLAEMAEAAGIYKAMWRPEEIGITKAKQLIEVLSDGLGRLRARPETFLPLNPSNGWGDYGGLCSFVDGYLQKCVKHPDADVSVSR